MSKVGQQNSGKSSSWSKVGGLKNWRSCELCQKFSRSLSQSKVCQSKLNKVE